MNTLYIHIDEKLTQKRMHDLKETLMHVPHVCNVEINPKQPHDVLIEFEPRHNVPMTILATLERQGLHSDVMSG